MRPTGRRSGSKEGVQVSAERGANYATVGSAATGLRGLWRQISRRSPASDSLAQKKAPAEAGERFEGIGRMPSGGNRDSVPSPTGVQSQHQNSVPNRDRSRDKNTHKDTDTDSRTRKEHSKGQARAAAAAASETARPAAVDSRSDPRNEKPAARDRSRW